ncbi:CBS domain-containing protein [Cohaesibacter sp. CAU 1516]|nr:CBS domain-containing protein [Cohaesibacter sp. CAU 1516]
MNDPDPSEPSRLEPPIQIAAQPESRPESMSEVHETTNGHGSWLKRLTNGWLSRLSNTTLRSQMEGALAEDDGEDETFSADEKAMLRNILALQEMRVDDVMIPRAEINAVEDDVTLGTLLAIYSDAGHSRLPVYRETLDDPVGMVHIKDVVDLMTRESSLVEDGAASEPTADLVAENTEAVRLLGEDPADLLEPDALSNHPQNLTAVDLERPLKELGVIRDILFVPPSMPAVDLMATMRAERTQMALVIDEYGGTDGLVSLEDVVETVVGDIEDEHDDEDEIHIVKAGTNLFIADAKAELDDVMATIGMPLPLDDESMEEVDSLGGFIFTLIGRIPVRGELIAVSDGLEFEIMEADRRRIRRIKIRLKPTKKPIKRSFTLGRDKEGGLEPAADASLAESRPESPEPGSQKM